MAVIWLCGMSGAGKTTIATGLHDEMVSRPFIIDGDALRVGLCRDLGFSDEDRLINVKRAIDLARLAHNQRFNVIVSLMTPSNEMQAKVRRFLDDVTGKMIYVKCPINICVERDVKGLYARAKRGEIRGINGYDAPFYEPIDYCDLIVNTNLEKPEESINKIIKLN